MFVKCLTKRGGCLSGAASLVLISWGSLVNAGADLEAPPSHPLYMVQPGDILEISVWGEPELQRSVLVRPDGGFSFPLVGDIDADGKAPKQLREEITERLDQYVPDATVSVSVNQIQGNKVYIIGKVNRPGEFTISRPVDVMQALSMAGGTTPFASLDDIKILRRTKEGRQDAIPFNYSQVERGKKLEQNQLLISGDVIVVP